MTQVTSKVLALGTISAVAVLGVASGVFGTFSTSIISGQNCSGYGYVSGYGYGYDCTAVVASTTGGGGGGSYVSPTTTSTTNTVPTATPGVTPSTISIIFPAFTAKCENEVKTLTDSRLNDYYGEINVINTTNTGRKVTRAEFLKLTLNSAGIDVSKEADPQYSDVASTHTLNKYIAYASRNGIVSGQNGKFRPNDIITRAEAAKVLVRGAGISAAIKSTSFVDISSTNSLGGYIQSAFDNCILHGRKVVDSTRSFEPTDGITLAETVKVLYNVNK